MGGELVDFHLQKRRSFLAAIRRKPIARSSSAEIRSSTTPRTALLGPLHKSSANNRASDKSFPKCDQVPATRLPPLPNDEFSSRGDKRFISQTERETNETRATDTSSSSQLIVPPSRPRLDRSLAHLSSDRSEPGFDIHEANRAVIRGGHSYGGPGVELLLSALNMARQAEGLHALILSPFLSCDATRYAAAQTATPTPRILQFYFRARHFRIEGDITRIEEGEVPLPDNWPLRVVRLVSPANVGALTCAGIWVSGKHRRHSFAVDIATHSKDCACNTYATWKEIMDPAYTMVGIAEAPYSRWIVEFMQHER